MEIHSPPFGLPILEVPQIETDEELMLLLESALGSRDAAERAVSQILRCRCDSLLTDPSARRTIS